MPVFTSKAFERHEEVHFAYDEASGLRAIIAIHTAGQAGIALGGCRLRRYESEQAALDDCLQLARGMTFKAAISRLPFGGGKAVVLLGDDAPKTPELLRAMGRFVDRLGGRFKTGEDIGLTDADARIMAQTTEHIVGIRPGIEEPAVVAAYGVFHGIRAAVAYRLQRKTLEGVSVAVQGVGKVGLELCRLLAAEGARLLVADINEEAAAEAVLRCGARRLEDTAIYQAEADVFAPCALGGILNELTIPKLRAGIVAGSANGQLASPGAGRLLHQRGILYAPDYVINAGGLINVALEVTGYDRALVLQKTAGIYDTLMEVFERAERAGIPTSEAADQIALERLAAHRQGEAGGA